MKSRKRTKPKVKSRRVRSHKFDTKCPDMTDMTDDPAEANNKILKLGTVMKSTSSSPGKTTVGL